MEEKIMEGLKRATIMKLAKAFGVGILFGLVSYLISGDGSISTGLALLLMYLEYNMK